VSRKDHGTIMPHIILQRDSIGIDGLRNAFAHTQEVPLRVVQYSQPIREVQMVCNHPQQIIDLQRHITDLQTKQFLPLQCDHTALEQEIRGLTKEWDEARMRPVAPGTDKDLRQERAYMALDARQLAEEVRGFSTQLENAVMLVASAAPAAPPAMADRGQKYPNSPDFAGSDQTKLRGWIAQLWMVI